MAKELNPIRLKGKKLIALYKAIWEREQGLCQRCGAYVPPGTTPHHRVKKSQGGGDTMDNLELLCYACHTKEHNPPRLYVPCPKRKDNGRVAIDVCLRCKYQFDGKCDIFKRMSNGELK